ncbi:MAG: enoyl-ACP reductase FabV [Candidatus Omnitrophota bacterium]
MIVKPKIRGYICTTAHPAGCARRVQDQIDYVRSRSKISNGPKKVLVIGASTGYGLATRITSAFGCGAATIGVFFEKPAAGDRTATAGWYNSAAFERAARAEGLYSRSFNGDAFSNEMKEQVIRTIQNDLGSVDMVVYSLAAPRRRHPQTGETFKGVVKPRGAGYRNRALDLETLQITDVTTEPATEDEVRQTVGVMGGEDWRMWTEALHEAGVLAEGALNVAYSYIGPEITYPIYRHGTIGAAKDDLEKTAHDLDQFMRNVGGRALVSVNKALVTQASSAIPFMALYMTILLKVMRSKGVDENCIEQIDRLFRERLFRDGEIPVDEQGRIRLDDLELSEEVQRDVHQAWQEITTESIDRYADVAGYQKDFLQIFGFEVEGVDYDEDADIHVPLEP